MTLNATSTGGNTATTAPIGDKKCTRPAEKGTADLVHHSSVKHHSILPHVFAGGHQHHRGLLTDSPPLAGARH